MEDSHQQVKLHIVPQFLRYDENKSLTFNGACSKI